MFSDSDSERESDDREPAPYTRALLTHETDLIQTQVTLIGLSYSKVVRFQTTSLAYDSRETCKWR